MVIYFGTNDDLKPWHEHSLPLGLIYVHPLCISLKSLLPKPCTSSLK